MAYALVLGTRFWGFESLHLYSRLTQLGECFPYKEEAVGSSPTSRIHPNEFGGMVQCMVIDNPR